MRFLISDVLTCIVVVLFLYLFLLQEIREKCEREANEKHFGTIESEKPQNRCLNRYRDVNPYDRSFTNYYTQRRRRLH